MNFKPLYLLGLTIFLFSCNSVYKGIQTPDDVYYSEGRPAAEKVTVNRKYEETEMRYTRMRCRNVRYRFFGEYDYNYSPYYYGYNYPYYYNPYFYPYPVMGCYVCNYNFTNPTNTPVRMTNLGSYYNNNTRVMNTKTGQTSILTGRDTYNNSNNQSNHIRTSRESWINTGKDTRTYSPSAPGNSSPSGSGAPIIRPKRN